jgi:hypothetical protein
MAKSAPRSPGMLAAVLVAAAAVPAGVFLSTQDGQSIVRELGARCAVQLRHVGKSVWPNEPHSLHDDKARPSRLHNHEPAACKLSGTVRVANSIPDLLEALCSSIQRRSRCHVGPCATKTTLPTFQQLMQVADCGCDYGSVERLNNNALHPLLSGLVLQPFFR